MKTSTIGTLIWVLVYGGLMLVGLGLSVQRNDEGLGYGVAIVGCLVAVVGFVLIYVRSRMNELTQTKDETP